MAKTEMTPIVSAYSPQKEGDDMEGGYASSIKGLDGEATVRTLEQYRNKETEYVTLAGHPDYYETKMVIDEVTYKDSNDKEYTLKNVRAYVHDTGGAFKDQEAEEGRRFDLAVDLDLSSKQLNLQPFSMKELKFSLVDEWDDITKEDSKEKTDLSEEDSKEVSNPVVCKTEPEESTPSPKPPKPTAKEAPKSDKLPWLETAKSLIGTEEDTGSGDNPEIMKWAEETNLDGTYTADSIPWCGLFVAYCMTANGIESSDAPLWALSWNNWGMKLPEPAFGCVLVYKRNGGGHVGFYLGEDDDYYFTLGGNQSDAVNIKRLEKARCVGYRWPSEHKNLLKKGIVVTSLNAAVSKNEA